VGVCAEVGVKEAESHSHGDGRWKCIVTGALPLSDIDPSQGRLQISWSDADLHSAGTSLRITLLWWGSGWHGSAERVLLTDVRIESRGLRLQPRYVTPAIRNSQCQHFLALKLAYLDQNLFIQRTLANFLWTNVLNDLKCIYFKKNMYSI
jgi:hypothetical protein